MIFVTDENILTQYTAAGKRLLKATYAGNQLVDAWMASEGETTQTTHNHVMLNSTANGLFARIALPVNDPASLEAITQDAYGQLFAALRSYTGYHILRIWNYVPAICDGDAGGNNYHRFNAGRYKAFEAAFGDAVNTMPIPAGTAVGAVDGLLTIECMAVNNTFTAIENKEQVPAYRYSARYGAIPPLFSRGVIFNNHGQRLLLAAGTASIVGEHSTANNDVYNQVLQSIHNLRILGSQFNLKPYAIHYGFALEDVVLLRVYYKNETDRAFLQRFVPKFFAPACAIAYVHTDICRNELLLEMEAVYVKKGEYEHGSREKYYLEDGLIRTESFELHVAEHCNLRCRDCCNISPFNAKKFLEVAEVKQLCEQIKQRFKPDVFKIAGGEPTLHPQLDELLKVVKASGVSSAVRVISNGLLLHRMTGLFWESIDQLTISHYSSAPMKPHLLEQVKEKARQYEVVLNIKYVEQFNEIFVDDKITDHNRIHQIYDDCWMRHRCLIIRNGSFYKCTRAAYMDDFLQIKHKSIAAGNSTYSAEDGIKLDDPAFMEKTLAYLNDKKPLHSCEYCLGVSGGLRENIQLKKQLSQQ